MIKNKKLHLIQIAKYEILYYIIGLIPFDQ